MGPVVLCLVLVLGACDSILGGKASPTDEASSLTAVFFSVTRLSRDDAELLIQPNVIGCSANRDLNFQADVDERESEVVITVTADGAIEACPTFTMTDRGFGRAEMYQPMGVAPISVHLISPLGDRQVINGSNGRRITPRGPTPRV